MQNDVFSFVIKADFGFFKKPDINKFYLTYNFIPRTVILGILGAILGLNGYNTQHRAKSRYPEFYAKLRELLIGIKPLGDFPYKKIINKYNNSTGHASEEEGGNLIVSEQLLIRPEYKIYVGLPSNISDDTQQIFNQLKNMVKNHLTTYTVYMGKNDFPITLGNFNEEIEESENIQDPLTIVTAFLMKYPNDKNNWEVVLPPAGTGETEYTPPQPEHSVMEHYPYSYDENMQYKFNFIRYTNQEVSTDEVNLEHGVLLKTKIGTIYLIKDDI